MRTKNSKTNEIAKNIATGLFEILGDNKTLAIVKSSPETSLTPSENDIQYISHVYNGNRVEFKLNGNIMVNATEMAKPFGKRSADWLRLPNTLDFINTLLRLKPKCDNLTLADNQQNNTMNLYYGGLVFTQRGGNSAGTWFHEDVALEFARWLSPEFAIWTNDRIKEILQGKYSNNNNVTNEDINNYIEKKVKELNDALTRYNKQLKERFGFDTFDKTSELRGFQVINKSADIYTNLNTLFSTIQNNMSTSLYYTCSAINCREEIVTNMLSDFIKDVNKELKKKVY